MANQESDKNAVKANMKTNQETTKVKLVTAHHYYHHWLVEETVRIYC